MKRALLCCLLPGLIAAIVSPAAGAEKRTIAKEALLDKIKGGWAGQIFGVVYGAPTEFRARGATYDAERVGTPAELQGALNQDDLYVEMTMAEVMDRYGLDATAQEYGEAFRDSKYALWHANLAGRRNLSRGIMPPQSGHPRYNAHANDIDFQIEADFIGLMAPGLPRAVQLYGDRIGHVMNYGDGVYGGIFIGAMYAAAFFENDTRKVVEAGLEAIPAQSGYAAVIRDLLAWHKEEPRDWRAAWKRLEDKWDRDDPCPEGALTPFNIDARLNGAFVALGLLYGEKDFEKTIEIAARAGQDSDCNPASAGGVLGVMLGYRALPSRWVEALVPIAGEKFNFTTFSYNSIVASTLSRAAALVTRYGGKVTADGFEIPVQKPSAMKLEQWDPGRPVESLLVTDARWQWKGEWKREEQRGASAASETAGSEAEISFQGTGAMVVGAYRDDGGYLEVYLDGKKVADTDGFVAGGNRAHESLWHADNLRPGKHTLRLVVTGKRYARSKGSWIHLHRLVVFHRR
jgi:hypothetical protein